MIADFGVKDWIHFMYFLSNRIYGMNLFFHDFQMLPQKQLFV